MNNENFEKLNALVRAGATLHDTSNRRPSEDVIFASLEGKATPEQLVELQDALRGSAEFRREFKELVDDFQAFSRVAQLVDAPNNVIIPPRLRSKLRSGYESSNLDGSTSPFVRFLKLVFSAKTTQVALVGATLVMVFLLRSTPQPFRAEWSQSVQEIESSNLRPFVGRGASATGFELPRDAALREFGELLKYDEESNTFEPQSSDSYGIISKWTGSVKGIDVLDNQGAKLGTIWFDSDQALEDEIEEIEFWSLNLEKKIMSHAPLPDLSLSIIFPDNIDSTIILAITYRQSGKYLPLGGIALTTAPKSETK